MRAAALALLVAGCGGGVFSAAADMDAALVDGDLGPDAAPVDGAPLEASAAGDARADRRVEAGAPPPDAGADARDDDGGGGVDAGWDGHCTPLPVQSFACGTTSCALDQNLGCWLGAADAGGNRCTALGAWCACVETYGCGCVGYPPDCRPLEGGGMVVGP